MILPTLKASFICFLVKYFNTKSISLLGCFRKNALKSVGSGSLTFDSSLITSFSDEISANNVSKLISVSSNCADTSVGVTTVPKAGSSNTCSEYPVSLTPTSSYSSSSSASISSHPTSSYSISSSSSDSKAVSS